MISVSGLLYAVMAIVGAGLVCWLLWWFIDFCEIPQPFNKIGRIIVAAVAVFVCIAAICWLFGGPAIFRP